MADQLRMEAVVTDRFTEPLKRLQERLNGVKVPTSVKDAGEHFDAIREKVEKLSEVMKTGLEPAFSGLGISGLALGGTFAGLLQATRSFAESTASLEHLAVQTGISINRFRELDSVFDKLGVKAETVNGSVVTFAQNLHDIQRNRGQLFGWLNAQEPQLAKQLHDAKSNDDALGRAYGFLQRIKDPTERAEAAQRIFGTSDIGRIGELSPGQFRGAIRSADGKQGSISDAAAQAAKDNEKANGDLRDALTGLRDDIGAKLTPALNRFTEGVAGFIANHHYATLAGGAAVSFGGAKLVSHTFRRLLGGRGGAVIEAARTAKGSAAERAGRAAGGPANDNYDFKVANDNATPAVESAARGSVDLGTIGMLFEWARQRDLGVTRRMARTISRMQAGAAGVDEDRATRARAGNAGQPQSQIDPALEEQARRRAQEMRRDPEAAHGRGLLRQTAFGGLDALSSGSAFETAIARGTAAGVVKGLSDYASGITSGADGTAGGVIAAAFHPGGGLGMGLGGNDNTPIGRAFRAARGAGGGSADQAGTGGSRSWRNNNPGNIEYGPFAASMGASGSDGRFAVFPDYLTGRKAQESLLFDSKGYRNLTLAQAVGRWAPGSENNVPAYIAAMHADPNTRMGAFSGAQRSALLDAMQKHEGWQVGTATSSVADGGGSAASAVDRAMKLHGFSAGQASRALGSKMTLGEWCADFVNGALKSSGMKGVNSSIANSFLAWGQEVGKTAAQKGDVLVENRGRGVGMPGGHAGLFTGNRRTRNGQLQFEMVSGNYGDHVNAHDWTDANRLHVRRSNAALAAALDRNRALTQGGAMGFLGAAQVNPEGNVTVNLHGFPQGARHSTSADGFFKDVKVNRGHAMSVASEAD